MKKNENHGAYFKNISLIKMMAILFAVGILLWLVVELVISYRCEADMSQPRCLDRPAIVKLLTGKT